MVSVEEAIQIILSTCKTFRAEEISIVHATGRILAEEIKADRDFPPFYRVAMDGLAIHSEHFDKSKKYAIEGIQPAGAAPLTLHDFENAIEVMTGSVLPENTNAVIRYEDVEILNNVATINLNEVKAGLNIHPQGQDAKAGEVLLRPGQLLTAAEIALLASVGYSKIKVYQAPKTAVIASGDELVDIDSKPEPHQIRRSNTYALRSAMQAVQWDSAPFYLTDNKTILSETLQIILNDHDVVIISGGVSKGKFDFIPEALQELGIKKMFHQVSQRPGKPFWFGASEQGKIVFALPGNPVSTFLCFHRFVLPWFYQNMQHKPPVFEAILTDSILFDAPLTYFLQVEVKNEHGKWMAYPRPGGGSGDFVNLKKVNGFLELPLEKSTFQQGETYPFYPFRPL